MSRLKGKIALVTGAAQGIGQSIASIFGEQGAHVIVTDLSEDIVQETIDIIIESGGKAQGLVLDVTSEDDWARAVSYVADTYGRLDILVNNAGIEMVMPIQDLSLEDWRRTQSVNVEGIFLGTKAFRDLLGKAGDKNPSGASIINMSSIAGLVGIPDQLAYNTSKGAVRQMTKAITVEFYSHGLNVRANSIHPGVIDTPMVREVVEEWRQSNRLGTTNREEIMTHLNATCPQKKMGTPRDIGYGACYLASDESSFVTGIELIVDGGSCARW